MKPMKEKSKNLKSRIRRSNKYLIFKKMFYLK